jgi:hypothetical protein
MTDWLKGGVLAMATLLAAGSAHAQEPDGTMVFARIASWQIARPNWDAYEADQKKTQVPILDKLMADGVITEYGLVRNTVHTPDGYTHVTWYSSKTLAGLEKALAAIVEADAKLPTAERRRSVTDFAGSKHSDNIARSRVIKGGTKKLSSGYMYVSIDVVQPGKGAGYTERLEQIVRPALGPLVTDGSLVSYGVDTEYVHTADPGVRTMWMVLAAADALDKLDAAQRSMNRSAGAAERESMAQTWRETVVSSAHRDELWEIYGYASKY